MVRRPLGTTGFQIAPLVLGGNVFGWTADEKTSFDLLDAFVDSGLNAIDTADVYSSWVKGNQGGESETVIGKWLRANPSKRSSRRLSRNSPPSWPIPYRFQAGAQNEAAIHSGTRPCNRSHHPA